MTTALLERPETAAEWRDPKVVQRDEMWDGELYMPPMADNMHQALAEELRDWLKQHWAKPNDARAWGERNLVNPDDEENWTSNYRIPDLNLVSADRKHINHGGYLCGAPLVCVEIRSFGDRSYEKLDFYSELGVPEIWIIDRSTRDPEVFELIGVEYIPREPEADGWLLSPATSVQLRRTDDGSLRVRKAGDDTTGMNLPED